MGGSSTSPLSLGSILNGPVTNYLAGGNPIKGSIMNGMALIGGGGMGTGGGFTDGAYGSVGIGGQTASAPTANSALTETILQKLGGTGNVFGQGGLMSQAGQGLSVYNQANQAFGGNDAPMQMAPAGQVSRGQIQPIDYMSLLNPQQQSVIRPPQISLLG